MPTYSEYPNGNDIRCLMEDSGIELPDHFGWDEFAEQASSLWELETRYKPFLEGESAGYFYDPPGPNFRGENKGGEKILLLDRGFTTITAIAAYITPDDAVGTVLTAGTDYRLRPYNAAADSQPYTSIEFAYPMWGLSRSIKVTGTPGYTADLSASVWGAIRDLGASLAAQAFREAYAASPVDWSEDDTKERYSIELVQKMGQAWSKNARRIMRMYTRIY